MKSGCNNQSKMDVDAVCGATVRVGRETDNLVQGSQRPRPSTTIGDGALDDETAESTRENQQLGIFAMPVGRTMDENIDLGLRICNSS